VASVENGTITAKKGGAATVTALSAASGQSAVCAITVEAVLAPGLYVDDDTEPKEGTGGNTISQMLTWIKNNGTADTEYTLVLGQDETITTALTTIGGGASNLNKNNITIILQTFGTPVTITKGITGALFTLTGNGADAPKLILENGITLQGNEGSNTAVVSVGAYGSFEMREGSRITGNNNTSGDRGSGVSVNGASATFTMKGGSIDNNIGGNSTNVVTGGGVNVDSGTFIMEGGSITCNTLRGNGVRGAGLYVNGTATMSGGTISNNILEATNGTAYGAGVMVNTNGTFNLIAGTISGNNNIGTASRGGGISSQGTLNLGDIADTTKNPFVKNNNAANGGGIIFIVSSAKTFKMYGGTISGNTASAAGPGLLVQGTPANITIEKTGGTIYGLNESGVDSDNIPFKNYSAVDPTPAGMHSIQIYKTTTISDANRRYYSDATAGPSDNITVNSTSNEDGSGTGLSGITGW
jgi:hypothetical protein